jgi:ribosomal-protein-alanine N-acetyltransferase
MPIITKTERLLLRTWEAEDFPDAFDIWGDPGVMRYIGAPLADLDAARRTLARASAAQERYGVSLWAVVEKASGEIVGACGFHVGTEGPELELAYHFKRSQWGRGFATEAARACVLHAAAVFGTVGIMAGVQVGNIASRRVLEKVGFRYKRTESAEGVDEEWFSTL